MEARGASERIPYRIEVRVDPAGESSCRTPRRLGVAEEGILRRRLPSDHGAPERDAIVLSSLTGDLRSLPAAPVRSDCRRPRLVEARGRDASRETG